MSVNLSKKSTHRETNSRKFSRKMYLSPQKTAQEKAKNHSFFKKDSQQFWESIGGKNLTFFESQSLGEHEKDNFFHSQANTTLSVNKQLLSSGFAQKTKNQYKKQCQELDHKFYSTTTVFVMKKNEINQKTFEKGKKNREKRITSISSPQKPQFIKKNVFRTKQIYGVTKRQNFAVDLSFSPSKQKNSLQNSYNLRQQHIPQEKIDAWNFNFEEDEMIIGDRSKEINQ